jgi:hypothetical protein
MKFQRKSNITRVIVAHVATAIVTLAISHINILLIILAKNAKTSGP